ncbi:hypothetical protein [Brachybacterium paraconglomeratum]|uniref:hypothetical protein n=1 Tax=Brachybacterium paraconglomeratum TaxID=173362 RepID=UPI0022AFD31F|nr:hypothetical protein [Brachybacterium paraconglomeratum]MCZ4325671.1 hypothetical protein [Brachybacterium paraconglomeratum]
MATFEELRSQSDRTNNVRKSLGALIFVAPLTADLILSLTSEDGAIAPLPDGYRSMGLFSRDAISFERETDTEATEAHGYMSPVREDITSISRTITATAYEVDRRLIREISDGVDLSAVEAVNGEISYEESEVPVNKRWRLLAISRDINKRTGLDILRANFYPQVELNSMPSEEWGDDALSAELTFTNYLDEDAGYARKRFLAGPGLDPVALGFGTAPVTP